MPRTCVCLYCQWTSHSVRLVDMNQVVSKQPHSYELAKGKIWEALDTRKQDVLLSFFFSSWDLFKKWKSFPPDLFFNLRIITNPFFCFVFFHVSKIFTLPLFYFYMIKLVPSLKALEEKHARTDAGRVELRIFSLHPDGNLFPCWRLMDEVWILSAVFFPSVGGTPSFVDNSTAARRHACRLACRRTECSEHLRCCFCFVVFRLTTTGATLLTFTGSWYYRNLSVSFLAGVAVGVLRRSRLFTHSQRTISSLFIFNYCSHGTIASLNCQGSN